MLTAKEALKISTENRAALAAIDLCIQAAAKDAKRNIIWGNGLTDAEIEKLRDLGYQVNGVRSHLVISW